MEKPRLMPPQPLVPLGGCRRKTGLSSSTSFVLASPAAIALASALMVEYSLPALWQRVSAGAWGVCAFVHAAPTWP